VCRSANAAGTPPQSVTSTRAADQSVAAATQNTGRRPPGGWQPHQPAGRSDRFLATDTAGSNGGLPNQWQSRRAATNFYNAFVYPLLMVNGPERDGATSPSASIKPFEIIVSVDGVSLKFILDTGSACTLMNERQFRAIWPFKTLSAVSNTMKMWDGSALSVVGVCQVRVVYEGKLINEFLFVCRGDGPA